MVNETAAKKPIKSVRSGGVKRKLSSIAEKCHRNKSSPSSIDVEKSPISGIMIKRVKKSKSETKEESASPTMKGDIESK